MSVQPPEASADGNDGVPAGGPGGAGRYMGLILRRGWRRLREGLLAAFLAVLLLVTAASESRPSNVDLILAPYQYHLLDWELSNLPDRWLQQLGRLLPGGEDLSRTERLSRAEEFFDLGMELRKLERELTYPQRDGHSAAAAPDYRRLREDRIGDILVRREALRAGAEQTIEDELTRVLQDQGLDTPLGVFPPVDAVFSSAPSVLVLSPRDRVFRQRDNLLKPGLTDEAREDLEARILLDENLSALVEDTGGVALYPSVVADGLGLRHALEITAHEWLHQWFFFRPLGRNFWSSPEMTTLNETAATLGGEELGDLAYTAMTGIPVERSTPSETPPDSGGFDFNAEMRETRRRTDELLAQGRVEEAEVYMERRRLELVDRGYRVRKLNQAYFAFHGTYATSPASTSPIGPQMRELRNRSGSLPEFLRTVSGFGSYQQFLDYLNHQQ